MIFVAEIGSNHKGIPSLAFEMIRQAKLAGADIAKFQLGHPIGEGVQAMRRWPTDNAERLKGWCAYWGVEFMASIFSQEGLEAARRIDMKRYKIAHSVAKEKPELCEAILSDGKETFVSGPVRGTWPNARPIWVIPEYPVYPWRLTEMPPWFGGYYGYSDHTHGIEGCLLAISRGAQYIEKHFTLDKTEESIRDNHFAATPAEFAELVRLGRTLGKLVNG